MESLQASLTAATSFSLFGGESTQDDGASLGTFDCIYVGTTPKGAPKDGASEKHQSAASAAPATATSPLKEAAPGGEAGPEGPFTDVYLPPHVGRMTVYKTSVHFKVRRVGTFHSRHFCSRNANRNTS
jgi:hypothetical protein